VLNYFYVLRVEITQTCKKNLKLNYSEYREEETEILNQEWSFRSLIRKSGIESLRGFSFFSDSVAQGYVVELKIKL